MHQRSSLALALAFIASTLAGCTALLPSPNKALNHVPRENGYHITRARGGDLGNNLILLTFSGGGTRAAALAYGVLEELRDTTIFSNRKTIRLLDDVDNISAVSGGSFTAAYYGLFGDRIFKDYEDKFLKKSIQGILIQKLFDPAYWWKSVFSGFDRTEMAIEYYDENIFEGKTFRDINLHRSPYIEINATNLGTASRFSFIQFYFDSICSDLMSMKIARAVTASSAVPLVFTPVVLENYAGECDSTENQYIKKLMEAQNAGPRIAEIKARINQYKDRSNHPYIHLIDGGVSDNLGSRATTERIDAFHAGAYNMFKSGYPENILMITVDADVEDTDNLDKSSEKPSLTSTLEAYAKAQIALYNRETQIVLEKRLEELKVQLEHDGHPVDIFSLSVDFKSLQETTIKENMNRLPTSLQLSPTEVDQIERVGRNVLRNNPQYRAFLAKTNGHLISTNTD